MEPSLGQAAAGLPPKHTHTHTHTEPLLKPHAIGNRVGMAGQPLSGSPTSEPLHRPFLLLRDPSVSFHLANSIFLFRPKCAGHCLRVFPKPLPVLQDWLPLSVLKGGGVSTFSSHWLLQSFFRLVCKSLRARSIFVLTPSSSGMFVGWVTVHHTLTQVTLAITLLRTGIWRIQGSHSSHTISRPHCAGPMVPCAFYSWRSDALEII